VRLLVRRMINIRRERLDEIKADILRLRNQSRREQEHLLEAIIRKMDRLLGEGGEVAYP